MTSTYRRLPTIVVAGAPRAGKTTLIRHWLRRVPADAGVAVLVDDLAMTGYGELPEHVQVKTVGGCACCSAQQAMRLAVMALLREQRVGCVIHELGARGHLPGVIDRLRQSPFDRWLDPVAAVTIVDGSRHVEPDDDPTFDHIGAADVIVLDRRVRAAGRGTAVRGAGAAHDARFRVPFERPILDATDGPPDWDTVRAAIAYPDAPAGARPLPRGGHVVETDGPAASACWRWPPAIVFDRAVLQALLPSALVGPGRLAARAAFRTDREWYGLPSDASPAWPPTPWRRDSRLLVDFEDRHARNAGLPSIEAALLRALPGLALSGAQGG